MGLSKLVVMYVMVMVKNDFSQNQTVKVVSPVIRTMKSIGKNPNLKAVLTVMMDIRLNFIKREYIK